MTELLLLAAGPLAAVRAADDCTGADQTGQSGLVGGGAEQGGERIALVPDYEAGCGDRSSGELCELGQGSRFGRQSSRIETERPGRKVASPVEVGHVLPVLVGDRLEFSGCPSGSIPPPRCHQTQPHQLRQSDRKRSGLTVKADVHHGAFLTALTNKAERVP
ncbi:hypothetical protein ACFVJ4_42740 [Streptomyces sp. NPDC127178]|uniref:hypothetical protein n=1 Tax=unclassified Streptomyces TaxID=2593676 RepID=UPI0036408B8D